MEDGMRTLATSDAVRQAAIREQLLLQPEVANKDQDTAFLIEFLGGVFGFLGLGYIYSGLTNAGLVRLLGMWAFIFVGWTMAMVLSFVLIGLCMMPFLFVAQLFMAYKSADDLKKSIVAAKATGRPSHSGMESAVPPLYEQDQDQL